MDSATHPGGIRRWLAGLGIWGFAFGYFAAYVPYSALTKAVSGGHLEGYHVAVPGAELLPTTAVASLVAMFLSISALGWWKYANRQQFLSISLPFPGRWTFLSGLCTAGIIITTTLAYTFEGISIVFIMLLLRGGLLVLAPVVDWLSGRTVRWFSWVALGLSMGALLVGGFSSVTLTMPARITVALYLLAYFIRLRFMSRLAKSSDPHARARYFVEEQMVATPATLVFLLVLALIGQGDFMLDVRAGFTTFFERPLLLEGLLIGLFSQGTGIFGGLILLDARENSFCIPVNRASSILAGVVATYLLTVLGLDPPDAAQLIGAALIVAAIGFLSLPPLLANRKKSIKSMG